MCRIFTTPYIEFPTVRNPLKSCMRKSILVCVNQHRIEINKKRSAEVRSIKYLAFCQYKYIF